MCNQVGRGDGCLFRLPALLSGKTKGNKPSCLRFPSNTSANTHNPLPMAPDDDTPGATPTHKRRRMRDAQSPGDRSPDASRRGPDRGDSSDYYSKTRDSSRSPAGRRRRAVSASSSGASTRSESPSPRRPARRRSASRSRSRSPSSTSSDRTRTESLSPKPAPPPTEPPTTTPPPQAPLRPNYQARLALHGHNKPVSQARISPDGRFIASASADATVKIWDAATGAHLDTLVGHMAGVSCVAWAPDSNTLASGSDDKAIRLWDRMTGRPKSTARKSLGGNGSGHGSADMAPLRGHHNYVHCLAFSPKGNIIASGSYDEAVFLWDVRAGRLMRSLPAHSDPVSGIDFSPDGTLVASCSTDGLIRIWDSGTGQCLRTLVHEDNPAVANVCFSPNGRFVLAFNLDNCIRLWDYVAGSVKKTYQGHKNEKFAVGGCFGVLDGSPFVASASEDGDIVLWDVISKKVLQRVRGHAEGVCFWVDVHGETMVSAGQDHTIRIYRHIGGSRAVADVNGDGLSNGVAVPATNGEGTLEVLPIRQEDVKMEM
ncbi:WD repeat-containing [Cordyceps militaris]|uniref:Mitochondrial division protein 1 n=1 Tax=Cordyceps militaris TaxID=73501 RepID=A0A2H4SA82_CORMI|nr:WD repeat-containing [Cordyceps militaris]